ncbi:MAG TPA: VIT1/CCC1 transporter family protein [Chloroflexota bacterium]|jgi:VIT1/CCC1 family predicted Fe2+/Mn2+ transporter|nr:VIT1/CCC1 transporter family protein [Chloroflexota bacterium]
MVLGRQVAQHANDEQHPHGGDWLREVVFGLNDGLVTTLVFIMTVSAVAGAASLVLIALSEIVAGGISMALGGYLSAKTEHDILQQRIATERAEIAAEPAEERAELHRIYYDKGLRGLLLERVIAQLTANDELWLNALLRDEHGVVDQDSAPPWRQGARIGAAFVVGGLIPALPFLLHAPHPRPVAYALTALTALALGALKARYTLTGPLRAALEFLAIVTGGTLAGIAIGALLHTVGA